VAPGEGADSRPPPATAGSCGPQPGDGAPLVPDPSLLSLLPGSNQDQGTASGGQSFTGDTQVLLPGGRTAPISSLKPGDKVVATDTETGKDQPETVSAVEVHHDTDLYDLTVKSGGRTEVIHTTASHLFWGSLSSLLGSCEQTIEKRAPQEFRRHHRDRGRRHHPGRP
jgi:hypothetical protein